MSSATSMRERFAQVTSELMDIDDRIAVVLAEISLDRFRSSGAAQRHPERVINVGIREQLMINVAAGMALEGMRPYAHTFAPFLIERAFEQVKLGFSHQGVGGVLVSSGASYDTAAYGRTHGAPEDVALIATLPDWRIDIPGHAGEVEALIRDAAARDDAVYIRLSERPNAEAIDGATSGRLVPLRRGSPGAPTVIAVGPMLSATLEAASTLDVTVLYAVTVRPFDGAGLRAAMTGSDVAIIEPYLEGTSAAEIARALSDRPSRILAIGVPQAEDRHYGSPERHDAANGLDGAGLRARLDAWLSPVTA